VRVFIDEQGLPRDVQVSQSTGFARLDEAAVTAVRKTRFKPCIENGVAVSGWALIPIEFELER
jgi:protein TonB